MRPAFFALCLAACALPPHRSTPTAFERLAVDATIEAWVASGLGQPEPSCALRDFDVLRPEHFADWCNPSDYSCLQWDEAMLGKARRPIIVIRPDVQLEANGEPIDHETLHALWVCSGRAYLGIGNTDHSDPRVWVQNDDLTELSVQARARKLVLTGQQ